MRGGGKIWPFVLWGRVADCETVLEAALFGGGASGAWAEIEVQSWWCLAEITEAPNLYFISRVTAECPCAEWLKEQRWENW